MLIVGDIWLQYGYNYQMTYQCWKGGGIEKAKALERDLGQQLGRSPTKGDYRRAGKGNVWMALYRYRRKLPQLDEQTCERKYDRIREPLLRSRKLMSKMVTDVCATLGPDPVEEMVQEFKKK